MSPDTECGFKAVDVAVGDARAGVVDYVVVELLEVIAGNSTLHSTPIRRALCRMSANLGEAISKR